jgi:hypothetical protein
MPESANGASQASGQINTQAVHLDTIRREKMAFSQMAMLSPGTNRAANGVTGQMLQGPRRARIGRETRCRALIGATVDSCGFHGCSENPFRSAAPSH